METETFLIASNQKERFNNTETRQLIASYEANSTTEELAKLAVAFVYHIHA